MPVPRSSIRCSPGPMVAAAVAFLVAMPALADIDLELRPEPAGTCGDPVRIGLYAVSDSATAQSFAAIDLVFAWNPAELQLVGTDQAGAVPILSAGLPMNDPYGLNEVSPPADGDGYFLLFSQLGNPALATPEGALVTTFVFEVVGGDATSTVDILPSGGMPTIQTRVLDGEVPGLIVTGALVGAMADLPGSCLGDLDCDGAVAFSDLLQLLIGWGACSGCSADLDGNGLVEFGDLLTMLAAWGPCPG